MNIANSSEIRIIKAVPPKLSKDDRCAIDFEFYGMEKVRLHRPHGTFAVATFCFNDRDVYAVLDEGDLAQAFENVREAVHIYANAKFDVRQMRRYIHYPDRKRLWDVLLIDQIMFSGYYSDFSLADLVRRYLDTLLLKDERAGFQNTTEMTKEMLEYSCLDTLYTRRVYESQKEKILEDDLSIWKDIELPFMWTILSMSGVRLDVDKWAALAQKNEKIAQDIQDKYGHWAVVPATGRQKKDKDVFVGINLNSPAQVKAHLNTLGYKMNSTDADALDTISDECEFARDMCVYRVYAKRASTYGLKFIADHVEPDGKIYADLFQMGAETGRSSCRTPNLQNQPHLPEYRDCFVADDGECMIIADWGSQEPRIAAYLSQDENLIDALNSNEKLYIRVARDVLGKEITKQSDEYSHIKSTVLGIFYGMSAKGLAAQINATEEEAQDMIDAFLETYPGVKEYMDRQYQAKDYVTSIYGRKIWLNKYSFQWERNALNAPIQGSAADAMKIAASRFVQQTEGESRWKLALLVHDEICVTCPEDDVNECKKVLSEIMISVAEEMHEGISGSVEIFSGKTWASKK